MVTSWGHRIVGGLLMKSPAAAAAVAVAVTGIDQPDLPTIFRTESMTHVL